MGKGDGHNPKIGISEKVGKSGQNRKHSTSRPKGEFHEELVQNRENDLAVKTIQEIKPHLCR